MKPRARCIVFLLAVAGLLLPVTAPAAAVPHQKKVAVVVHNPKNPGNPNERLFQRLGWPDHGAMTQAVIDTIRQASNGHVVYQLAASYTLDAFSSKGPGGPAWTWDDYLACHNASPQWSLPGCQPQGGTYTQVMTPQPGVNLCEQIRNRQIDEIWVWAAFYFPYDEFAWRVPGDATMYASQPYNYWLYDGRRYDLPDCGRPYFVMGWVPAAGLGNTLHSYGHRVESALSLSPAGQGYFNVCSENRVSPSVTNEWLQFTCIDRERAGQAACGTVHFPPNATADYDYGNFNPVPSSCGNWLNYPNLSGPTAMVNVHTWAPGGDPHEGFMAWWFRHIPRYEGSHVDSRGVTVANDWWPYILNYEDPNATPHGNYPQVYLRGTHNAWATTAMTLVANNLWEARVSFGSASNERFKFDIRGDWSLNFGDSNRDGVAEQNGADILVTQGSGEYTIRWNDLSRAYTVSRTAGNQAPVANAGPDQTLASTGTVNVTLDGSASRDPDGTIVSWTWEYDAGGSWQVAGASAVLTVPLGPGVHRYRLTVADVQGAAASDEVLVTISSGYDKTYNQLYLRGTFNNWGTTAATLVNHYLWEATVTFGAGSNERFKWDVHGNWTLNFGDSNRDGIAEQGGADVPITQGAGSYRIRFNDRARAYTLTRLGGNQAPIAHAGPDQTVAGSGATAPVTLDGSASSDADGSITGYVWDEYVNNGWQNVASGVRPTLPAVSQGTHRYRLTVTDNQGATASDEVVVTVSSGFAKTYDQVYLRGTHNGWGTTLRMTLVGDYSWEATASFGTTASERFKFDINGDWLLNFGDSNRDGTAEQNGADIPVTQGAGSYRIRFNDRTRVYSLTRQ